MSNFGDSPDIGDSPERSGINSSANLSSSIDSEETALSKYEHELERMMNESLANGQDLYTQKLFIAFQNAAKSVTKMFRGEFNFRHGRTRKRNKKHSFFVMFFRKVKWDSQLEYISCSSRICDNALQR